MSWFIRAAVSSLVAGMVLTSGCAREEVVAPPRFSVRLLTSPTVSGRWERAAEQGLGRIAAQLDADVARHRVGPGADSRGRIAAEGEAGSDLVFCVGAGFEKTLYLEAGSYPETVFVMLPGRIRGGNVASIEFLPEGVGYLAGVVAATVAPNSRVGILRGSGRSWLEALETGFLAGFRANRRRAEVETVQGVEGVWALNVTDVSVALYASDEIEPEVAAAAREAGLRLIVTGSGLMAELPGVAAAAVDIDVAEAMLRLAREVHDGNIVGRTYSFDLGSGVLDLTLSDDLDPDLRTVAAQRLEAARAEVTAGLVEFDHLGL